MADARMSEEFYEVARPMLPPEKELGPELATILRPTAFSPMK